jgi:hypothetical protein
MDANSVVVLEHLQQYSNVALPAMEVLREVH